MKRSPEPTSVRPDSAAGNLSINELATGVRLGDGGIHFTARAGAISYPEEGNEACFAVEEDSFWFKHRNLCIAAVCENFLSDRFLMDVGGGNGAVSAHLAGLGFRTILIEPGIHGCANARRRGLAEVICGTLEEAAVLRDSVPAIGCFDVIEHIENQDAFLSSCHQALRPGGKLIATVPAFDALWSHEDIYAGHFRRYRLRTLAAVLERNGFQMEFASYCFSLLVPVIALGRVFPYRLGFHQHERKTGDFARDHTSSGGRVVERLLRWEVSRLRKGRPVPCGSSCLIVASARKRTN